MTNSAPVDPRRFCILGTAGHIDHGKSALVRALTGIDPDRLPEEKARGMTIELGFAYFDTPAARFAIVDVPGHERFIKTMVSGATGIDIGLLVVAADDGIMPQTREHVDILDLLLSEAGRDGPTSSPRGLIALNKCDLVDVSRIETVTNEIRSLTTNTALQDWPIRPVSALTRAGLDDLIQTLQRIAAALPPRRDSAIFRLAIDRVFPVAGRGTVVTGSVLSGTVAPNTALDAQPTGLTCRVREVQSHGSAAANVRAGQRAALNLTGIDRAELQRGHELCTPGFLTPSRYIDARIRILPRYTAGLDSFRRVRVSMATHEEFALLVLLDAAHVGPNDTALAQLRFKESIVASHGQRFIFREENAEATIGGGTVLRPIARRIGRRDADEITTLSQLESPDPAERLAEAIRGAGFTPLSELSLACRAGLEPVEVAPLLQYLRDQKSFVPAAPNLQVHTAALAALRERAVIFLKRHHERAAAEPGIPTERYTGWIDHRSAPNVGRALLATLLQESEIQQRGPFVAHRSFRPALSPDDEKLVAALHAELTATGLDPPTWDKLKSVVGQPRAKQNKLLELARSDPRLTQIAPDHFAATQAVNQFRACLSELGRDHRKFTLAQVRDALKLSRRAVQPMLEYFDRVRFTKRTGDERVLI